MNIWIVNPFDPLPGDPEQEGRYATLARMLVARGHSVSWWTSSFSHRFKRPVDQEAITAGCRSAGIKPQFLETPPYQKNVGLARIWNHHLLGRRFRAQAPAASPRPDAILASSPPPGLVLAACQVGQTLGARTIVDVQDLWPDTFRRIAPGLLRPLADLVLWPSLRTSRRAYASCDAVVGVADAYVERATELARAKKPTITIPLGVDLQAFDTAAEKGVCERWTKPPAEVWLAYTGSLNRSYDFLTIIKAASRIRRTHGERARFFITSRGDQLAEARRLVEQERLTNVTLTGFLDFDEWAYLLTQCDAGFNASFPEALIYLPNKIFYYLAAGVAVLNTIPGQCSEIIREGACGLDYRAGNVQSCVQAVERILGDLQNTAAMGQAARNLAETTYDRKVLFPRYAEFIEQMITHGGRQEHEPSPSSD